MSSEQLFRDVWAALVLSALPWMAAAARAQEPPSRELEHLNWMEVRELVPARIRTVLLPLGTLEGHGVAVNGSDTIAPLAMARAIAPKVNALIAPAVPYGITGSLEAYPGGLTIPDEAYRPYVRAILHGLARSRFKNVILLNGHGGNTAALNAVAAEVGREAGIRTLVVNWWTFCSDVTLEVFGEDGGHAGENENAYVMAVDPSNVRRERYTGPELAIANPAPGAWSAYPSPASILLYKPGEGLPRFDAIKAKEYFDKVNAKVAALVEDIVGRWDRAGI
ncbi:MAG TPA: creatininase family protein [Vicinamibacterales bacterium]|nr:creatininase family protein [Vicinamibacterales bacterium]